MTTTERLQVAMLGLKLARTMTNLIDLTDKLDSYTKYGEFAMVPVEQTDMLALTSAMDIAEACSIITKLMEEDSKKERA